LLTAGVTHTEQVKQRAAVSCDVIVALHCVITINRFTITLPVIVEFKTLFNLEQECCKIILFVIDKVIWDS
jgi:hypothetical protein